MKVVYLNETLYNFTVFTENIHGEHYSWTHTQKGGLNVFLAKKKTKQNCSKLEVARKLVVKTALNRLKFTIV